MYHFDNSYCGHYKWFYVNDMKKKAYEKNIFPICNRCPQRAPKIFGHTFILCWRCTMCIVGIFMMMLLLKLLKIEIATLHFVISVIAIFPMIIDGLWQYRYDYESNNYKRAITGLLFGLSICIVIKYIKIQNDDLILLLEEGEMLVNTIITIVGFIVTFVGLHMELKNMLKINLTEQQRTIYANCIIEINRILTNNELVFESDYYHKICEYSGLMELVGSNKTILIFEKYIYFLKNKYEKYHTFVLNNDPHRESNNYEVGLTEEGNEYEVYHGSENDDEIFEMKLKRYKRENISSKDEINKLVFDLINSMRKDIGNNKLDLI